MMILACRDVKFIRRWLSIDQQQIINSMIILDTNIISEVMRSTPNPQVIRWLNEQNIDELYLTSVSLAELYFGLYRMADGKRKTKLLQQLQNILDNLFRQQLLDFTCSQSALYGNICTHAEKIGKPIAIADAQIAAITAYHQATLATRNTKDFKHSNIKWVNPFELPVKSSD